MRIAHLTSGIVLAALLLSACGGQAPALTATPTAAPSATIPAASPTPVSPSATPTATETPSETPRPSSTPRPTLDASLAGLTLPPAVEQFLDSVVLTRFESFDTTRDSSEMFSGNLETLGASLAYSRQNNPPEPGLPGRQQLPAGQGLLFLFNYESGARFTITYRHNRSSEPEGARLGLSFSRNTVTFSAALGDYDYSDQLVGNLNILPDHWYYMLLAVGADGKGIALVWDFEDPGRAARTTFIFDPPGEGWNLNVDVTRGNVLFDNYAEFTFTTVK
ncbi:MAG: hypothetical protein HYZ26_04260 [Chloroflexi bacterium]|nr:hypothetical protein [Chloroflexota bacterium]